MKIYDYKLTKLPSWCLVLCMSFFFMTNSLSAQIPDISCDDQVNVSVGENCSFTVAEGLFTEGTNNATGGNVYFSNNPTLAVPIGSTHTLECGTYTVTVEDASGNSCWGTVVIEDKLPPQGVNPCPTDGQPGVVGDPCNIHCFDYAGGVWASQGSIYLNSLMDCSLPLTNTDPTFVFNPSEDCLAPDILYAIYSPVDAKGNVASDTLMYFVHKARIGDIMAPPAYTGDCDDERCPGPLAGGYPGSPFVTLNGVTIELGADAFANNAGCSSGTAQVCDILISYEDLDLPTCEADCSSSTKIIRSWTFLDWCTQEISGPTPQVIHLKDNTAPVIEGFVGETEFSVDPWLCAVENLVLPIPIISDNCDQDQRDFDNDGDIEGDELSDVFDPVTIVGPPGVTIVDGVVVSAPKGEHVFTYYATDCCGNVSMARTVTINVRDEVAPIAIAKQFTVVSLSNQPGNLGIAKVYAESIDNGSYDRCTDVLLQIRRDGYYATGGSEADDLDYLDPHKVEDTWDGVNYFNRSLEDNSICNIPVATYPCDQIGNDTYADSRDFFGGWNLPAGCNNDVDTDEGRYVKFCCDDLDAATVDVNYDGVDDPGYVKVWLRVWDNANMSMDPATGAPIYGDVVDGRPDYFNETWAYVKVEVSSPPVLVVEDATINCDWPFEEKYEEGFFGEDCLDEDDTAYDYAVTEWMDEYLTYEGICDVQVCISDIDFTTDFDPVCREGYIYIEYTAKNPDSKGLEVKRTQKIRVTNLDALQCNDVAWPRSYTIGTCAVTNDEPYLEWEANACSLIGWTYRSDTFRFESDACVKIINEYTVIDWCAFDDYYDLGQGWSDDNGNLGDGYFEGGHDYFDGLLCQDPNSPYFYNDTRTSDNGVYKYVEIIKIDDDIAPDMEVQDTMYAINNLDCNRTIQLEASATDGSDDDCPATWFKWEITFDWDGDGDFTDDYTYTRDRFAQPLRGPILEFVPWQWTSSSFPYPMIVFEGPMLSYDVQYIVFDGCGNVDKEVRNVMIVDKKDPTPYCVSLSSAVMDNGQVELWARDFDKGSFDNCYDDEDLLFTFNEENPVLTKLGQVHYFKGAGEDATIDEYNDGDAQKWDPSQNSSARIFDCDDVAASPVDVRMTVWDPKLNSDWCSVELTLIDNQGACDDAGARASISGNIATEENSDVSLVEVTLENLSNPEYELTVTTGNDGDFAFASNPMYNGYDVSAVKDGEDTEGVSTLDLVLIQRHILGITPFDSPYKVIAADINSDRRVSGTDLVVLRKAILGIYKEFPTNNSWRFVEGSQALTVDNALIDFNEVINIQDLDANMLNEDFVAVKIGDVNATAKTNARDLGTQTRSAGTLTLGLNEQNVNEGQLVDLTFSSSDFNKVYGYQFTLELNGLTIESVQAGDASMTDANIGILDENTVTVSYSDIEGLGTSDNLFTLSAIATESGSISQMINLTNSALISEGYVGEGLDIHTIDLTINGDEATSFRLEQNEPNPFDEVTVVGFELPASGNATLTVYDVAGKIVTSVRGTYAQGYNEIKLNKEDLNTTGVLYYTLQSGEFSATKKMIIIE